jgi:cell division protein FtsI (penicillin-binding protein 3)
MAILDRRIGLLFGGFVLLLVIAVGRAGYLGLFRAGALTAAAQMQQVQTVPIPAVRGEIMDRNGQVLALSEAADQVIVNPYLVAKDGNARQIADEIAPILGMKAQTVLDDVTKPRTGYVTVASDAPGSAATQLQKLRINGLSFEPVEQRVYPRGTEAAQVLGWVNADGAGGGGLEYLFNKMLRGDGGTRRIVNDAQGQAISVTTPKPMVAGKNLQLTISSPLESEVQSALDQAAQEYSPTSATAIVTNPQTDQVLAVANWPSFNANDAGKASANELEDDAVGLSYEPGSTFKAITVSGALQDGLVTPNTSVYVPSELDPYGKLITDAENHPDENLTVANILKYSSNIGAVEIGLKMGADNFASWVRKFGFGKPTGVQLAGEQQGVILPVNDYSGVSMYNLPFGQGQEVTPMQMVQAYDAIADGGVLRSPQIVQSVGGKRVTAPKGHRIISTKVAGEMRDMLRGVLADGGTASGAAIPGYDLAGKTGTAQDVVDGKYSNSLFTGSFIGMVPASDPKLVVAVVLDGVNGGNGFGGTVAAPAFQKIVGWAVPYLGINPCPSPCPASAYESAAPSTP